MRQPKNDYVLDVLTDKNLGSSTFANELLDQWCGRVRPELRPEFFASGEPVKRRIAVEGIEAAVQEWVSNQSPVMLRRGKAPRFLVSIDWRAEKGLDTRPFPWSCTVWLDSSASEELVVELFSMLLKEFEPAFGSVSTQEDRRKKHRVVFQDRIGEVEKNVGQDIGDTLPGIYWMTYLGAPAVRMIGEERLAELRPDRVERLENGYLIRAFDRLSEIGAPSAVEAEERIATVLGRERFFDKGRVDIESLRMSAGSAKAIEAQIAAMKAGSLRRVT